MGAFDVAPTALAERASRAVAAGRAVVAELRRHRVTVLAASFAFHAFVSILPLLLLVFVAVSFVLDESLAVFVVEHTSTYLTPGESALVVSAVTSDEGRVPASVLGVAVLLWGTLKVFRQIDVAFAVVYDVEEVDPLPERLRDGLVTLFAMGAAVTLMLGVNLALDNAPGLPPLGPLKPPLVFVGLAAVFLPLYYVVPDADVTLREAVPGALVAAFGWMVLEAGFGVYLEATVTYEAYGLLGGLLLFMLWLYVAGLVLVTGAVVNAVLGGRSDAV